METVSQTVGVDLAKNVFSICELDDGGRVRQRRDLQRAAFAAWLAQLPASTVVAMEACSGAHHWARRCLSHGLVPKLMAAQFVKPFRKSQANDVPPPLSSTAIWSPIPHPKEIGREEALFRRTDHRLPA